MKRYIFLLVLFLSSCATPTQLINRALKKDPEILRSRTSAEVTYITDTVTVYMDGEVVKVPVSVPVEVPVIKWVKERTNKEERLDARLQKAELQRFRLTNDSLEINNKKLKQEARILRAEANAKNKENTLDTIIFMKDNWLFIILFIFVLYFTPKFIKWLRNELEQRRNKQPL